MQLFLIEVRKRCVAPSILWLHDGFWIHKAVDYEILLAAERHVRKTVFPASQGGDLSFLVKNKGFDLVPGSYAYWNEWFEH